MLEYLLQNRRSIRHYKSGSIKLEQVIKLLWAGVGKNIYNRTSPSAGGCYPLELYLIVGDVETLEPGIYHYNVEINSIDQIKKGDIRQNLSFAALRQQMIIDAQINIVIAADYNKTIVRYRERAFKYVHIEVGHVGQNISLQAIALELGSVMIGAFDDDKVKDILGIKEDPIYIIPVGIV